MTNDPTGGDDIKRWTAKWRATTIPTIGPTATPTLPPSYNACQADPNSSAAPNYPVRITNINKLAETVTLQNVSTDAIHLTGWQMCSIIDNQHHPISDVLAPRASQIFPGSVGPFWCNDLPDPGMLLPRTDYW